MTSARGNTAALCIKVKVLSDMFQTAEDSISRKNWDWRDNKIRISKGQTWKKNDSGNIGRILAVSDRHVVIHSPCKKRAHHLQKRDLLMFWKQI